MDRNDEPNAACDTPNEKVPLTPQEQAMLARIERLKHEAEEAIRAPLREEIDALRAENARLREERDARANRDTIAWLVERGVNGPPEWVAKLDAYADGCVATWTTDASKAIWFRREQDAAAILPALGGRYGQVCCTEHMFVGARNAETRTVTLSDARRNLQTLEAERIAEIDRLRARLTTAEAHLAAQAALVGAVDADCIAAIREKVGLRDAATNLYQIVLRLNDLCTTAERDLAAAKEERDALLSQIESNARIAKEQYDRASLVLNGVSATVLPAVDRIVTDRDALKADLAEARRVLDATAAEMGRVLQERATLCAQLARQAGALGQIAAIEFPTTHEAYTAPVLGHGLGAALEIAHAALAAAPATALAEVRAAMAAARKLHDAECTGVEQGLSFGECCTVSAPLAKVAAWAGTEGQP